MIEMIEFAEARLAEEEELAKAAKREGYPVGRVYHSAECALNGWWVGGSGRAARPISLMEGRYAARNDPDRTFRDIEGKRAIVAGYREACSFTGGSTHAMIRETLEMAVRNLLLRWSDHPGYDEAAWKP